MATQFGIQARRRTSRCRSVQGCPGRAARRTGPCRAGESRAITTEILDGGMNDRRLSPARARPRPPAELVEIDAAAGTEAHALHLEPPALLEARAHIEPHEADAAPGAEHAMPGQRVAL